MPQCRLTVYLQKSLFWPFSVLFMYVTIQHGSLRTHFRNIPVATRTVVCISICWVFTILYNCSPKYPVHLLGFVCLSCTPQYGVYCRSTTMFIIILFQSGISRVPTQVFQFNMEFLKVSSTRTFPMHMCFCLRLKLCYR